MKCLFGHLAAHEKLADSFFSLEARRKVFAWAVPTGARVWITRGGPKKKKKGKIGAYYSGLTVDGMTVAV